MQFAYADPPYPGQAMKHYGNDPRAEEVSLPLLFQAVAEVGPDGWAISTNTPSLLHVLSLAPVGTRVGAWVKPFAVFKPGVNPAYAWEPVIFYGGRKRSRQEPTVRDWVSANITLQRGIHGAKPLAFNLWILDLLGFRDGDVMVDMFPGTGSMGHAIEVRASSMDL